MSRFLFWWLSFSTACECHALGSARDDCEQTTGRCACRHGVQGDKCDSCSESMLFAQDGTCLHGEILFCKHKYIS